MSTEQSYVGRGTNATPPPQMAQNAAQTPITPDDWREDFLLHVGSDAVQKNSLFRLLDLIDNQPSSVNCVRHLSELLNFWVKSPYSRLEANENRFKLQQINNLISFLIELDSRFDVFNEVSEYYCWVEEKEVGNE